MSAPVTRPGDTIGSYVVERSLGEGGFAQVWLAHHAILHSRHAIKLLDPQWLTNERMRERFLAEGRILAQMRHPHLVAVTDVLVEYPERVGLVMEFVEGKPLSAHIEQGPITFARAAAILGGMLAGVGYAHARGIVHRDLKPANVIVMEDAGQLRPVVLDFGIAKVLDDPDIHTGDNRHQTKIAARLGTPEYMSPEQVASSTQVDARSDIWALGVILHEMLTGQAPFLGATPDAIYTRILRDGYEAPPALPPAIRQLLQTALARQPSDRFQTCQAFADALRAALSDPAGTGTPARGTAAATMVLGNERQTAIDTEPAPAPERPPAAPPGPAAMPTPGPAAMPAPPTQRERTTLSTGSSLVIGAAAGAAVVLAVLCAGCAGLWWALSTDLFDTRASRPPTEEKEGFDVPKPAEQVPPAPATLPSPTPTPATPPSPTPQPAAPPSPAPPAPTPAKPDPQPAPPPDPPRPTPPKPEPPKPEPPKPDPAPTRPPDSTIITGVWDDYKQRLSSCTRQFGDKVPSNWKVKVTVRTDGSVKAARAYGTPHNADVADCIESNVKSKAQFGQLQAERELTLNVTLPAKPTAPQRP